MDHEGEYASRWATVASISAKIGCSAHTLLDWVKKAEIDSGRKSDFTLDMTASLKPHQHEVRELRQANEILGKASAFFAQRVMEGGGIGSTLTSSRPKPAGIFSVLN